MRANAATTTASLNAEDLKKKLKALPPKVQQAIMKKAMRKALAPIQSSLKIAWSSAPYRGKPPHRLAIARNTKVDVRRRGAGFSAPIVGKVGVDYTGKKGMLQRIWHLLEGGFKRYAKGSKGAYQNLSASSRIEKKAYKKYLLDARKAVMNKPGLKPRERGQLLRKVAADARDKFPGYVNERKQRAKLREKSVAANNAYTKGAWRSKAIAKSMMPLAIRLVRDEAIAAAETALKGGTS